MKRIKILYLVDTITSIAAGSEGQLAQLINHLDREKFEPHLVALTPTNFLSNRYFSCPIAVLNLPAVFSMTTPGRINRLADYIRDNQIHIVQTLFPGACVVGPMAARRAGCRLVLSSRRDTGYGHTIKTLLAFRYANRYVTRFLANSEYIVEMISKREKVSKERFTVIYNGLDPKRFEVREKQVADARREMGVDDNNRVVGIVANPRPVKDIPTFIKACSQVSRTHPETRFVIIGGGDQATIEELGRLAVSLGLSGKIVFTGPISNPIAYVRNFDIGCLSSLSEGLSNTLLEYGALGIPAVATRVGGNPEVIRQGKTGYLVSPEAPEELAEKINQLLDNDSLREKIGKQACENVWKKFNVALSVKLHQSLYTKLYDQVTVGEI